MSDNSDYFIKRRRRNNRQKSRETTFEEKREKRLAYYREYNKQNFELLNERAKDYQKNNPKWLIYKKTKINCACGNIFQVSSKSSHIRCKKHLNFINKQATQQTS